MQPIRKISWHRLVPPALTGALVGAAVQMNRFATMLDRELPAAADGALRIVGGALGGALVFAVLAALAGAGLGRLVEGESPLVRARAVRAHGRSYLVFLGVLAGAFGVTIGPLAGWLMLTAFAAVNGAILWTARGARGAASLTTSREWLGFLFLVSGVAALIYQVTWQRTLFAFFGVNIESVTAIVSLFMLGLGLGSLVGGRVSRRAKDRLPALFLICEALIGAFGLASLPLMRVVGEATRQAPLPATVVVVSILLLLPTLLMGATLPILVTYLHDHYKHVGKTVGLLYFLNTLGSALACFLTADVLFVIGGQQTAVLVAAACNVLVGILVYRYTLAVKAPESGLDPALAAQGGAP